MAETPLESMFESESMARIQSVGAENIVELTRLAFICEPCEFKSGTHEVLLTRDEALRNGNDPEEMLIDNAIFQGTPAEVESLEGLVGTAFPEWQAEARRAPTNCAARLGDQSCKGTVQCTGLYRTLPEE
jgi:hypothetical protein